MNKNLQDITIKVEPPVKVAHNIIQNIIWGDNEHFKEKEKTNEKVYELKRP